ncbi:MAG TPA: SLC13 family permease [Chloroflexota bacterium]|nr:SLC13 family permease [Chloroflexota bacterium]
MTDTLTPAHTALLARTELFAHLDRIALARLAACTEPLTFAIDETVCHEGDPADGLYVVVRGSFGIFAADSDTGRDGRIGAFGPGEVFGEMALLADDARAATIRAETGGEVLRLERQRFTDLLKAEPSIGLAVAITLARRLRDRDRLQLDDQAATAGRVDAVLSMLSPTRRQQVLEASVLKTTHSAALRSLFGLDADEVAAVLTTLSSVPGQSSAAVQAELRGRLARSVGAGGLERVAETAAQRLAGSGHLDDALAILDENGLAESFASTVGQLLRSESALPAERSDYWVARLTDDQASRDPDLALARAQYLARLGHKTTTSLLGRLSRRWRAAAAVAAAATCVALVALTDASDPIRSFALLLTAAVILWIADIAPPSAVGLGLVAAWILSGIATPTTAIGGFASLDWLFVLGVFGISAAVARSGLLFRVGLLVVRRLPDGLFWQAGSLLLTGVLLTPLLPTAMGRAAITEPLALAVADSLRLRDRHPAAAVLGLAAWIGAGPLRFLFLNGSSTCLLAWGLLPAASRARFDLITWLVAALPLALVASIGGLLMLFVVLRPEPTVAARRGQLDVQLTVLGPPTRHELAMMAVLLLTVAGWLAAPTLHLNVGLVAILGWLGAVATGNFDRRSVRTLDWDYLIFYGVALSLVRLGAAIGLDRLVSDAIGPLLTNNGPNALEMVLGVALVSTLVCLLLGPDQTVLLLGLTLIPTAGAMGVDPWVVVITILATTGLWLVPSQMPMYLAAYSASEGRLFSPLQSRNAAFGYLAVTLVGLALAVPYWHLLHLL